MHAILSSPLPATLLGVLALTAFLLLQAHRRRRQAEAQLGLVERELATRSRFMTLFAHELHGMGLGLMGHGGATGDAALEAQARSLMWLAADATDCAAAQAGPRVLREESLPLAPVLQDAVDEVAQSLSPGKRRWRIAPELQEMTMLADRRALRGAFVQVLTRAVRHSGDGDSIELRLVRADDTVSIVVEDEGSGRSAGDLSPASAAKPEGTRGMGLGLAVARQLLRAHQGELSVEAVQGIGARTWVTLPRQRVAGEQAMPAPAPGAPRRADAAGEPGRALVLHGLPGARAKQLV
jgi:signal transduction histidine kinase